MVTSIRGTSRQPGRSCCSGIGRSVRKLSGAEFRNTDLVDTQFRGVDMSGVVMRGVDSTDVDIYGEIDNLTINGVQVSAFVNAELDRRYPERATMRPADPAGFREAWDVVERLWGETVERARHLDPELLHESVGSEWSFIETLRHLVFVAERPYQTGRGSGEEWEHRRYAERDLDALEARRIGAASRPSEERVRY